MFIDTHTHLTDEKYGCEAENIIKSLEDNGIKYIISVGYDAESSKKSVELAEKFENVYAAVAVHPQDSFKFTQGDYGNFTLYAQNQKVAAIGETGLDYHYGYTEKDIQKGVFLRHIELAYFAGLPLIIHCRDAYGDMYDILRQNREKLVYGGVMHCFSGSAETARQFLDMGFYISFAGSITFKNAKGLIDSVRAVPLGRLLTETDCPYLTPEPHRGTLNYPYYVKFVAEKLAEIKEISVEKLQDSVISNARALFKRIKI